MNFFSIFNVIYKLFSKRGRKALIITLLIIIGVFLFSYNQVFAYSSTVLDVTYPPKNLDITIDNSDGFLSGYDYCFISQTYPDSQYGYVNVYFTTEPVYFSSDYYCFFVANNGTCLHATLQTEDPTTIIFTLDSFDFELAGNLQFDFNGYYNQNYYSVSDSMFTDSTLTTPYTNSLFTYDSSIVSESSSGGGASADYSDVLNHIDEQVTSTNTTIDNIDNNVYEIKVILQGQNTNDVVNAVSSSSATTQNIITNTSSTTQAMIQNQTTQSQSQFNTLISNTYDDSDVTLPTDNNTDITSNGFDAIFTAIYNAMTANTYSVIEIPIPYCNESIYIDPNVIRQAFDNTIVTNLIGAFYYFLVGLFIYKDIAKIIQKIKDGSIATSSDTNIKTTML